MLYMIEETFEAGAAAVYERLAARGRMLPDGVDYVESWVTEDMSACYQVMRCDDPALLEGWMAEWRDLVDFRVIPVITGAEARQRVQVSTGRGT